MGLTIVFVNVNEMLYVYIMFLAYRIRLWHTLYSVVIRVLSCEHIKRTEIKI